jgi:hypothetical protein
LRRLGPWAGLGMHATPSKHNRQQQPGQAATNSPDLRGANPQKHAPDYAEQQHGYKGNQHAAKGLPLAGAPDPQVDGGGQQKNLQKGRHHALLLRGEFVAKHDPAICSHF